MLDDELYKGYTARLFFLSIFSSHLNFQYSTSVAFCGCHGMYRERNTDTRHVTDITRPPITEFPITRPPSPSSPISDQRADFGRSMCSHLGHVTLSACTPCYRQKGSLTHVDFMGFICMNSANDQHVFTSSRCYSVRCNALLVECFLLSEQYFHHYILHLKLHMYFIHIDLVLNLNYVPRYTEQHTSCKRH